MCIRDSRRVIWRPPTDPDAPAFDRALAELGARPWQREIVVPLLVAAFAAHPD